MNRAAIEATLDRVRGTRLTRRFGISDEWFVELLAERARYAVQDVIEREDRERAEARRRELLEQRQVRIGRWTLTRRTGR